MRFIGLVAAFMIMAAAPAQAAWQQVMMREDGFAANMPAAPTKSTVEYRSALLGRRPATVYTAVERGNTYTVTIVDVSDKVGQQASILQEAIYIRTRDRKIVSDDLARSEPGLNAVYGRRITEDLADGSRTVGVFYLTKNKLYIFDVKIPATNDKNTPASGRFIDSVVFNLDRDWNQPPPAQGGP